MARCNAVTRLERVAGLRVLDTQPSPTYNIQVNFVSPKDRAATPAIPEVTFIEPGPR